MNTNCVTRGDGAFWQGRGRRPHRARWWAILGLDLHCLARMIGSSLQSKWLVCSQRGAGLGAVAGNCYDLPEFKRSPWPSSHSQLRGRQNHGRNCYITATSRASNGHRADMHPASSVAEAGVSAAGGRRRP